MCREKDQRMLTSNFSAHARERNSQRNIAMPDVEFVMRFGRQIHNGGALFVFLGHRDIPDNYRANDRFAKLEGIVLVISNDGRCLITVCKNKRGLRQIKKKCKHYIPKKRYLNEKERRMQSWMN